MHQIDEIEQTNDLLISRFCLSTTQWAAVNICEPVWLVLNHVPPQKCSPFHVWIDTYGLQINYYELEIAHGFSKIISHAEFESKIKIVEKIYLCNFN